MARPKVKVSEARSFRIRKDLGERLDGYSETSYIPKTVINIWRKPTCLRVGCKPLFS